jgi:uncharacterized membrane protein
MNLGRITMSPILPMWAITLLLCLFAGAVAVQYLILRKRLGGKKSLIISLLRLAGLALLACFAVNPSMIIEKRRPLLPTIAVLLDTSQTMGLPGRGGSGSRLDEARNMLLGGQEPLLQSLAERFDVRVYALGQSMKRIGADDLANLRVEGKEADLAGALATLAGSHKAAVFLSDGSLGGWHGKPGQGLPLVTLPLGDPDAYKDMAIRSVKVPTLAFRGREVAIDVTIGSRGYGNVTVPVFLKEGNRLLAGKSVYVSNDARETAVSLSFTPEEVGSHVLALSIPLQTGEAITSNNRVDLPLKVMRDKIRVLMLTGSPGLNYRFMRMALKDDPTIDLLSFVVLRTPLNTINVPVQEQSLIPFPVDTLFLKELPSFDLLICDDFPFHFYLNSGHLEKIRDFVGAGGGLAMIGGVNFSDNKQVSRTPIGEILPVQVPDDEDYARTKPSGVKLSRAGTAHPVTRLEPDKTRNERLWQEMTPLDGFNLLRPKSMGTVLIESTNGFPVLTTGAYNKGRVVVLATDYAWKWDMAMVAKGSDNRAYLRLTDRMIRWLIKDPAFDPIVIGVQEGFPKAGEEAEVRVSVKDGNEAHTGGEAIILSVFDPEGRPIRSKVRTTGQPNEFVGSFSPEKQGVYRVRAETRAGRVEEAMVVRGAIDDLDAFPDHQWLSEVSKATGGTVVSDTRQLLREVDARAGSSRKVFTEESRMPLWGTPYVVAVVLLLLGMEWYLRRRWGLS